MKRTDQERIARELSRVQKHAARTARVEEGREDYSVGAFARRLTELFMHDGKHIYNISDDEEILETLLEMKEYLTEKEWNSAFKKAVKTTKVKEPAPAIDELRSLIDG